MYHCFGREMTLPSGRVGCVGAQRLWVTSGLLWNITLCTIHSGSSLRFSDEGISKNSTSSSNDTLKMIFILLVLFWLRFLKFQRWVVSYIVFFHLSCFLLLKRKYYYDGIAFNQQKSTLFTQDSVVSSISDVLKNSLFCHFLSITPNTSYFTTAIKIARTRYVVKTSPFNFL